VPVGYPQAQLNCGRLVKRRLTLLLAITPGRNHMKWLLRCHHCKHHIFFLKPNYPTETLSLMNSNVTVVYHPHCYFEKQLLAQHNFCIDGEFTVVKEEFKPLGAEI